MKNDELRMKNTLVFQVDVLELMAKIPKNHANLGKKTENVLKRWEHIVGF